MNSPHLKGGEGVDKQDVTQFFFIVKDFETEETDQRRYIF